MAEPSEGTWTLVSLLGQTEIRDEYGNLVARLGNSNFDFRVDQANGRLMAASKELLAACEDSYVFIADGKTPPGDTSPYDLLQRIKAAIAKAKGVTP